MALNGEQIWKTQFTKPKNGILKKNHFIFGIAKNPFMC